MFKKAGHLHGLAHLLRLGLRVVWLTWRFFLILTKIVTWAKNMIKNLRMRAGERQVWYLHWNEAIAVG